MHARCFTEGLGKGVLSCCKCHLHSFVILFHIKRTFMKLKKRKRKNHKKVKWKKEVVSGFLSI